MHPQVKGSPDLILPAEKIAVFIHGCFWHRCLQCYKAPKSNRRYWSLKIKKNVARDKRNKQMLRKQGFKVIFIWEHELK